VHADVDELRDLFVRLAGIASPTGAEREMADAVRDFVTGVGLDIVEDDTAPVTGCGCGNLLVRAPGRGAGTCVALCAHLDTVPVHAAPRVVVENGVVRSDGETVLGADDKAAVAALLLLARDLAAEPPALGVELLFTAGEEEGLLGAKAFDITALAAPFVFVLDSEGAPGTIITGAPSQKSVDAEFLGQSAHAGIEPERGRNAIVAAARAVAAMRLGRIDEETTANIGLIEGGSASNVVADRCVVRGEARSRDSAKMAAQAGQMVDAITLAASECGVDVEIDVREAYQGYRHDEDGPLLRVAAAAATDAGLTPRFVDGGGGSDSNVFNARGLPAATLGVGFEHLHSPRESMRLDRLVELHALAGAVVRVAGAPAA
jgi:tripeptide aminopeptidase